MMFASDIAPVFLEALYDASETLWEISPDYHEGPSAALINDICARNNIGWELRPPMLILRDTDTTHVEVPTQAPNLGEQARRTLHSSLTRSDQLLTENRPREAVQEILWLLETVSTAFRGAETRTGTVEGKYFNRIG